MEDSDLKKTRLLFIYTCLSAICFIYGVIIRGTGSGTGFFIAWFAIGALFFVCDIVVVFGIYGKIPKILRRVFVFFAAIFLSSFVIVEGFVISGFFSSYTDNLDYIIILGAQIYPEGPSDILKYRLDAAAKYLKKNPNTICIVSGGQGYNEPFAEALGMKTYLKYAGIDEERILLEVRSQNTQQNIKNSMRYIEPSKSVGIVTNNFHMFRALQIAKKQGLKNVHAIVAGMNNLYLPNNMLREYFAELYFLICQGGGWG